MSLSGTSVGIDYHQHSRQVAVWVLQKHLGEHERISTAIGEAESRLSETTTRDTIVQNLRQIKGVGLIGACTIRAEIGTANRFRTGKQLARFCGVTPRNCSSGERQADAGLAVK